jgi:hypothetical protein
MRRLLLLAVLAGVIYALLRSGYLNSVAVRLGDAAHQFGAQAIDLARTTNVIAVAVVTIIAVIALMTVLRRK